MRTVVLLGLAIFGCSCGRDMARITSPHPDCVRTILLGYVDHQPVYAYAYYPDSLRRFCDGGTG